MLSYTIKALLLSALFAIPAFYMIWIDASPGAIIGSCCICGFFAGVALSYWTK
jgi:hypothetical protein